MARKLYSANNEFMFRIPTSEYIEIDKEEDYSKICRNKEFREKIRVASPALIEAADRYFIDGEKLSEKKEKNLCRFLFLLNFLFKIFNHVFT